MVLHFFRVPYLYVAQIRGNAVCYRSATCRWSLEFIVHVALRTTVASIVSQIIIY